MKDTFPEKARWSGFFALDSLRGGEVKRRFRQDLLAYHYGTSVDETKLKIRNLIRHAVKTTSFYGQYDPDTPLEKLPVIDKNIMRKHYDEMRSSDYLHAKDNRIMTTSGSTGTPLSMVQDKRKALCNTADSIFLESLAGYHIGEKCAFIRVWVKNVRKSRLQLLAENSIMMDSSSLSDASICDMLDTLKSEHVKMITGYSSALGEISRYIEQHHVDTSDFEIHSIIPISETMPDPVRKKLRMQFHCPVQQTYSNEENGIMAIQSPKNHSYYVNSESYYYEILKMDSDEPAEDGELGRIVITDLTNYAFPILRYDNGDTAIARHIEHDGRYHLYLDEVYGRRSDLLYDTSGNPLTPYIITNNLWNIEGVGQYRFLQLTETEYELRLSGDPEKADTEDILSRIRPYLGEGAKIKVVFVDEIPVLASGKRKYIENLCPRYQ